MASLLLAIQRPVVLLLLSLDHPLTYVPNTVFLPICQACPERLQGKNRVLRLLVMLQMALSPPNK